ncbi:hypothetical protein TRFO_36913 [Tritrichomonas foetus]|uniref:Importin N-terminal domain-containing protein n=1 Tax=Tritrichomonas foetus TaxID=1144522 RepID=A0A1J4JCQ4_9EUKA|nr:hypothetical protein TRFO_36913 [Tritrichomonas foetus]|eukprot:OHS96958.1 hypothetical protein TRFO_36913 [Tritrichomonas foetus]
MNIEQFQEVLLGMYSSDMNIGQASREIIQNFKEADYSSYINFLIQLICSNNDRIINISITLLFTEVKSQAVFQNQEIALQVLQNFTSIITNVLTSPVIQDNFKMIMSTILAFLHVYIFRLNSNVSIPTYILTQFNQIISIRKYLIHCVFEIVVADPNFGGFSFDDLLKILVTSPEDLSLFTPRIHLFFAIAMNASNIPTLHEIFPSLLSNCPEGNLRDLLISISDFAERSAYFFLPHLEPLVQKLCQISVSQNFDFDIRNPSIIALGSIAKGAPEMCATSQCYYLPVLQAMITIAAEIEEDSPWDYDANYNFPHQTALEALNIIFASLESQKIFQPMTQIIISVLSKPDLTWQAAYAVLSATAEMDSMSLSSFLDNENRDFFINFLGMIARFINLETHPRVRYAAYNLVAKLSPNIHHEKQFHEEIMNKVINLTLTENNPYAKKCAYKCLTVFLSQTYTNKNNDYLQTLLPALNNEIRTQPPEFFVYILRCMGHLMKAAREDSVTYFPAISKLTASILSSNTTNPEFLPIRVEAIKCFSLAVTHVPKNPIIKAQCLYFYQNSIQLLNSVVEKDAISLYDAVHTLILNIGEQIEPYVPAILPKILADASKAISIEQQNPFGEDIMLPSLFIKIPSSNNAINQYASKTDVDDVYYALEILDALVSCDPNFLNYGEQVLGIVGNWICNDFAIDKLKSICWETLSKILRRFHNIQIIDAVFHNYLNSIEKYGNSLLLHKIMMTVNSALSIAKACKWENLEYFASFLKTLPVLADYVIEAKQQKIIKMQQFNNLDLANREISQLDTVLSSISSAIKTCFSINMPLTGQFYNEMIGPKTEEYLQNDVTLIFGITMTTAYIIGTGDRERMIAFIDYLIKNTTQFTREDDLVISSFFSLGQLFSKFPLENPQLAMHYLEFFAEYFNLDELQSDTDQMTNISDYANICLAKFCMANHAVLDHVAMISTFIDALPLWEAPEDSDKYFQFLVSAMENHWIDVYDDWIAFVIGHIITGVATQQYSEATRLRFRQCFIEMSRIPEKREYINNELIRMNEARQIQFRELMKPGKNTEVPNNNPNQS